MTYTKKRIRFMEKYEHGKGIGSSGLWMRLLCLLQWSEEFPDKGCLNKELEEMRDQAMNADT